MQSNGYADWQDGKLPKKLERNSQGNRKPNSKPSRVIKNNLMHYGKACAGFVKVDAIVSAKTVVKEIKAAGNALRQDATLYKKEMEMSKVEETDDGNKRD